MVSVGDQFEQHSITLSAVQDVVFGLVLPDKEWKRDAVTQDALLELIETRCRQLF